MSKTDIEAKKINLLVKSGKSPQEIISKNEYDDDQWYRFASKAYALNLAAEEIKRKEDTSKRPGTTTSVEDVYSIMDLNEKLADYALSLPTISTTHDFKKVRDLAALLPESELKIVALIGEITMNPRMRVLQNQGRFKQLEYFESFSAIIEAATLCYFRCNYISCYLTLVPVVEGVIIRWLGYTGTTEKPEFEAIRKFFRNSPLRQPCPGNIHFHQVFSKVADKICNNQFYKQTTSGGSYANFNRHLAAHLLSDDQFATKSNCIRLFILLDTMTDIYIYESRGLDPRFNLSNEQIARDVEIYTNMGLLNFLDTPESTPLKHST